MPTALFLQTNPKERAESRAGCAQDQGQVQEGCSGAVASHFNTPPLLLSAAAKGLILMQLGCLVLFPSQVSSQLWLPYPAKCLILLHYLFQNPVATVTQDVPKKVPDLF